MKNLISMTRIQSLLVVALLGLGLTATAQAQPTTCVASGGTNCPVQIPDGPLPGVSSTIDVPAVQCARGIQGVAVNVDITQNWIGDLRLVVTNPAAQTATLLDALPGAPSVTCSGDDVVATFSDLGAPPTCQASLVPSLSGMVSPVTPLAGLAGTTTGTWTLTVTDLVNGNNGALNDWGVEVVCNPAQVPTLSNHALVLMLLMISLTAAFAFYRIRA
jgi:subtilisin-like proprotein convertase family protein